MNTMSSQITSLTIVYSTVYSGVDQRKHRSSASLAFVRGIHRWPVNSPHTGPVTRRMFPFDDVIMESCLPQAKPGFQPCSDVMRATWRLESSLPRLFVEQLKVNMKISIRAPHYWPFVLGIHRRPVDSPHKGLMMLKVFPWHAINRSCSIRHSVSLSSPTDCGKSDILTDE